MPEGSVGRGYYAFLTTNGLQSNLATNYRMLHDLLATGGQLDRMPADLKYAVIRGFQIHDILHVVTGYTPSGVDELALQAFCLAQLQFPYFGMWMATTTSRMRCLFYYTGPKPSAVRYPKSRRGFGGPPSSSVSGRSGWRSSISCAT